MIGNTWKKRFNLNNDMGATWIIEDVGASTGLLENLSFFEWDSKLLCYAQNGVPLWSDTTEECNLNVAVPESNPLPAKIMVSPNPAQNYTHVTLPGNFRNTTVMIYDMMGRVIFQLAGVVSHGVTIPLPEVSPGLYMVTAISGDSRSSVRLVVK
jgi:hypothetical protein